MLKYNTLKEIALSFNSNSIPINAINFAIQLGIDLKTEQDYINEWGEITNPLVSNKAVLAQSPNGFTIYYRENEDNKNFFILHECCHFLAKHKKDGLIQEFDANLLACIFLAPINNILEKKAFSIESLSNEYGIPIKYAELYYNILIENEPNYTKSINNHRKSKHFIHLVEKYKKHIVLLIMSISIIFLSIILTTKPLNNLSQIGSIKNKVLKNSKDITVVVTKSGEKYHKPNCQYVENKNNTIELSINEALKANYKPCSTCQLSK